MPSVHTFQASFWSPTASTDAYPDFAHGFSVLHKKLTHSILENESILTYIEQRIACERVYADALSKLPQPAEELGGLSRCFGIVCAESKSSSMEHVSRAHNVHTTSLDPLQRFFVRYRRIVTEARTCVEYQIRQFEAAVKQLKQAKTLYQTKCQAVLHGQPNYRPTLLRLGNQIFHERYEVESWLRGLAGNTKESISAWLTAECQSPSVLYDLVGMNFLRQVDEDRFEKVAHPRGISGFFKRDQQIDVKEMLLADRLYRDWVTKIDTMRTLTEEMLFVHYEEMENLELERIQTLKQAFISLAASLSNTIPRYKETVDNMMLYQETLKPDKDVEMIVEQYRTGRFCPRPILYENYFYGAARHQLFGVSLDEVTKAEGTLVPRFISKGISVVKSEKEHVWITSLPLDRVHTACREINQHYPLVTFELFQRYDILLVVSLVKLYLMELPDCLFTFELYEPCKLLYSNQNQDRESRLFSISKLLAMLPSANYHVCKLLFSHFHGLVKDTQHSKTLAHSLSCILLRPQTESKVSAFERHPQRLIEDLIDHYPLIFTEESSQAQKENSARSSIVVSKSSLDSLDSLKKKTRHHLMPSSPLFEDPDDLFKDSKRRQEKG